jgi:hypothetical protein
MQPGRPFVALVLLVFAARAVAEPVALPRGSTQAGPISAEVPSQVLIADGPPSVLISQNQRVMLGLRNGPDSITDLWTEGGRSYLVFSGASAGPVAAGGATFRVAVDPNLRTISGTLEVVMRADCRDVRPEGGRTCTRFDSDYAGAGTIYQCPGGRTLYFYHGENHTTPGGSRAGSGRDGWTGIGQAAWDPARQMLGKDGQIAGLNISNGWVNDSGGWHTSQTAAASGNPSVAPDPSGAYLYLYFGNRTNDPAANGPDAQCASRTCWAIARAPLRVVCASAGTGRPAPWSVLSNGNFNTPALLPGGTGGEFTPLLGRSDGVVDNLANVTFIPALRLYVMTVLQQPGAAIAARYSTDGLAWSPPAPILGPPPPGVRQTYPRILALPGSHGEIGFVLTYVVRSDHGWSFAELRRQPLRLAAR